MTKITGGTAARTIILGLALLNQVLTISGHSLIPIEDETITTVCTEVFTVGTAIYAWWKNNSVTPEAIKADVILEELKSEEKAV